MSSKEADPKNQYEKDENLKPDDVEVLVNWTRQQPHLPDITELEAIIFLHSRCYSIEAAKSTIDNFFTIRTMCPEIFQFVIQTHQDLHQDLHIYITVTIMLLMKRYLKGDLFSTIHVHSKSIDSLHNFIPMDILPKEYGGKAPSTTELKGTYDEKILEDSDFFDYLMSKQVDENLRPGVTKNPNDIFGLEGTFKTLQVD